jgi:hypothetical protein
MTVVNTVEFHVHFLIIILNLLSSDNLQIRKDKKGSDYECQNAFNFVFIRFVRFSVTDVCWFVLG